MVRKFELLAPDGSIGAIVTQSQTMLSIMEKAEKIADADINLLITGEVGTGKKLVARFIHSKSRRRDTPFIPLNAAAISSDFIDSELPDRVKESNVLISILGGAAGGSIFLEGIELMKIGIQDALLRFLTEGGIRRGDSNELICLDVRIISATAENPKFLLQEQTFLKSLYFRLAVATLELPPLRERSEDIILLANYFLEQYSRKYRKIIVGLEKNTLDFLLRHKWTGNVLEMEKTIESAVIFSSGRYLSLKDFGWSAKENGVLNECDLKRQIRKAELKCITTALSLTNGNIERATRLVGLKDNRKKFYDLLRKHQIDISTYRGWPADIESARNNAQNEQIKPKLMIGENPVGTKLSMTLKENVETEGKGKPGTYEENERQEKTTFDERIDLHQKGEDACVGTPLWRRAEAKSNRSRLVNLKIGMTKEEVVNLMGEPSKAESYEIQGKYLEFLLYLTEYEWSAPYGTGNPEYTPLVFEDGVLKGWERNYYDHLLRVKPEIK